MKWRYILQYSGESIIKYLLSIQFIIEHYYLSITGDAV